MVKLTVRPIGTSLGVILPASVLEKLRSREQGANLYLVEAPDGYHLVANDPTFLEKMQKAEDIMNRYPDTLAALAK